MSVNIEQVREALDKATGGEWKFDDMCYVWSGQQMLCQIRGWGHMTATLEMSEDEAIAQQDANAHLVANMCSEDGWGKQMADEIEALRAERDELVQVMGDCVKMAKDAGYGPARKMADTLLRALGGNDGNE